MIQDLHLTISRDELQERLYKLEKADLIAMGPTFSIYKGLGDKIFEVVFRRIFEAEIQNVDQQIVEEGIRQQLKSLKGELSYYKGVSSEYRVINMLSFAQLQNRKLEEIVNQAIPGLSFGPFLSMGKKSYHLDQQTRVEVDIFCQATKADGTDLIIEVKDWKTEASMQVAEDFCAKKKQLEQQLKRETGFIFYSENGVSPEVEAQLWKSGIMVTSRERFGSV